MVLAPAAAQGFQNAGAYDAHRPAYPAEAVDQLLGYMHLTGQTGARIVEVAAGTGKLTEVLAGREEAFEVHATEPHEDMRRTLEAKGLHGVVVKSGRADELGTLGRVQEGWADGVLIGQAFHWFATNEALGEIRRALKPGGRLGMIWNIDDYNKPKSWQATTPWAERLSEWIHGLAVRDDNKRFRDMAWQEIFATKATQERFSVPLGEARVEWTHWLSEEALWARIGTLSHVAMLQGEEREDALRLFRDALSGEGVVRNEKGEVECHGWTYLAWTERL